MEDVKSVLQADADKHVEQGLHLEHLWQNVDDPEEIIFLFRIDNPILAKQNNLLQGFTRRHLNKTLLLIYRL